MPHSAEPFLHQIRSPFRYKMFLLSRLPAAYFSGLKLVQVSEEEAQVSVPYKWFTQNPFRSTYFACLAMAAEMSTGVLAMAQLYKRKPAVSMLIVQMESHYLKKATGRTVFTCSEGALIRESIRKAIEDGQPQQVTVTSTGKNSNGEVVAEFRFTWSFKKKE